MGKEDPDRGEEEAAEDDDDDAQAGDVMHGGDGDDASARYSLSCYSSRHLEDTCWVLVMMMAEGFFSSMGVGGRSFPVCAECQCHR